MACEQEPDLATVFSHVPERTTGATPATERSHILTVGLEDYFQVGAFGRLVSDARWDQCEPRLVDGAEKTLDLLDRCDARATFFVLGWTAERWPELIREIADRGHEIASRGYSYRRLSEMSIPEFREELARSREAIEAACGQRVLGYRVANGWLGPRDLWALDVLAEEGYAYDSSLVPLLRRFANEPHRRVVHQQQTSAGPIWEVPPSTARVLGCGVPIAGGNAFRQFPQVLVRKAIDRWCRAGNDPFVMYFHTWEMDGAQPRVSAAGPLTRVRHYRNIAAMPQILEEYLTTYRFHSIAGTLDMTLCPSAPPRGKANGRTAAPRPVRLPLDVTTSPAAALTAVMPATVVIPCYNEEKTIPHLVRTLGGLEAALADRYDLRFILVDDGSQDGTWRTLQTAFADKTNVRLVAHRYNRGIAAAIRTGISQAETEIVCSIDCDGSYDPHELGRMIPLLIDGVDLVTASPYHRDGHVRNVPNWRLTLSKGSSFLYRRVLGQDLATFTSCCRVYRKSAVDTLELREDGFLGIAELAGQLALRGSRIVEHSATLDVRLFGQSKMKIARTICGHLRLLGRLAVQRCCGSAESN